MNKLRKILIASIIMCMVLTGVLVLAIQLNWYEVGDLTGTIQKNEVVITKGHLNLGSISSGSSFEGTTTAIISIPVTEAGGLNVSKFFLIVPGFLHTECAPYLQERFTSLTLNITMGGNTYTLPVVVGGVFEMFGHWDYEDYETDPYKTWFSYDDWTTIFLTTDSHNMDIKAFGVSSAPSVDLAINLSFAIELT